ncbi:winged helix-turn-helix transcriptional regulator, partial [Paraglaciecola sp.]|uniref:winged helix-turn-helix transcriptional regulator n=1 Tax=Paraglaciecola sp. TaxID=1920173 RepID=UPI003EF892ED
TLLIIRDLMADKRRYGELESSPEGIRTNILASRLKLLVDKELVAKALYQTHPPRYEYRLTDRGKDLTPLLKQLEKWGLDNIEGTHAYINI